MNKKGFTLIELLIVVAIIAILAAIAVPNFLEAQTRAKVSRTTADMRTLATALETYIIDHNRTPTVRTGYPGANITGPSLISAEFTGTTWVSYRFRRLTTPISYISTVFPDIFAPNGKTKIVAGTPSGNYDSFDYFDDRYDTDNNTGLTRFAALTSGANWRVASCGPDNIQLAGGSGVGGTNNAYGVDYDATNGTISTGDIVRVGSAGRITPGTLPAIDRVKNVINQPGI